MRRTGDAPWELWAILIGVLLMVVLPVITGMLVVKIYRSFRPIEEPEEISLANLGENNEDGFFKKLIVGWLICGPVFYVIYNSILVE